MDVLKHKTQTLKFLNDYIIPKIGDGCSVTLDEDVRVVKTLNMVNNIYSWVAKSELAIFCISFNDLDFTYNAVLSLHAEDPELDDDQYMKCELENLEFEEVVKEIKEYMEKNEHNLNAIKYVLKHMLNKEGNNEKQD